MNKLGKKIVFAGALLAVCVVASADDLTQVYQQALVNDPTFKKAQADWLSAKENLPLALTGNGTAGTGLFPNLTATANYTENYQKILNSSGNNAGDFVSQGYLLTLTQPIFNFPTWMSISSARYAVRSATATYLAAAQDLMKRTSDAYFEVLRANQKLLLTIAQKKQFLHQLVTSEEKFKVGLIAITGVYDAKASYDRSIAQEIADRNGLQDRLEDLRAITGTRYKSLLDLKPEIPLMIPKPNNIQSWVNVALQQNYVIQRDLNAMFSARQNIKVAATANLPQFNFVGTYGQTRAGSINQPAFGSNQPNNRLSTTTDAAAASFQLNFPVFRGGYDIANTKQTRYNYLSASDQLAIDHRTVENDTRQAFLGIQSGISQIQADKQTIISTRNQLEATKAGYIVGTRTMVDVLDSVTTLTQAQQAYADGRYNYVEDIIALKEQAGTLSPNDLRMLNRWLKPNIVFQLKQPKLSFHEAPKPAKQAKVDLLDLNDPKYTDPGVEKEAKKIPESLKIKTPSSDAAKPKANTDSKATAVTPSTTPPKSSSPMQVAPKLDKKNGDSSEQSAQPNSKVTTPTPSSSSQQPGDATTKVTLPTEPSSKVESQSSKPQEILPVPDSSNAVPNKASEQDFLMRILPSPDSSAKQTPKNAIKSDSPNGSDAGMTLPNPDEK